MLFNSPEFLLFFPLVTLAYFWMPHRLRWLLLLASSCLFYMAFVPSYILILAFTITIDYLAGIAIGHSEGSRRRGFLFASLVANLAVLAVFKYFDFLAGLTADVARLVGFSPTPVHLGLLLPIGLSFHTFQAMAYTIEVYRGRQAPERHFGLFALYVMFYPQLVAGPIERPQRLLAQFREKHNFDCERVAAGLTLMLWGFFQKTLVADRLGVHVDPVFSHPESVSGLAVVAGSLLFAGQVYADFSGYTDIALGSALVMGFRLSPNFKQPYFSRTVQEFWTRWHISLSQWLRDYLFLPVAYSLARRMPSDRYFGIRTDYLNYIAATTITMAVCGLWHGANWTFVLWGLLQAAYMIVGFALKRAAPHLASRCAACQAVTVFLLISAGWLLFRAGSVPAATAMVQSVLSWDSGWFEASLLGSPSHLAVTLAFAAVVVIVDAWQTKTPLPELVRSRTPWMRWGVCSAAAWMILLFGEFSRQPFIYFQF